jgi:hypothetical protein
MMALVPNNSTTYFVIARGDGGGLGADRFAMVTPIQLPLLLVLFNDNDPAR